MRRVEDRDIVLSGSLNCPSFGRVDKLPGEKYSAYVRRHCQDHDLGEFDQLEDAERNCGIWCFFYNHKYVFGNATLLPQPFYEIHAFIAWDEWNEEDLEERVSIPRKKFTRLPDAADRKLGDVRQMKQIEVPRQCEKTSIGSNAYSIFRSLHEYYVNDERNFPIMIRSETTLNARDSLGKIRAKAKAGKNIKRLYGVRLLKCAKCGEFSHISMQSAIACPGCGETKKVRSQEIALIDPTRGAGGTGRDSVTFRWATNTAEVGQTVHAAEITLAAAGEEDEEPAFDDDDFEPEEESEEAVYSVRAVGLKTALTGQRPRLYVLDDIQSEDNSDSHEKRIRIINRFDEAKRQVEFGGQMLVFNTRKYVDDFAGQISIEPLRSLFHTLHRRVYWETDEPDAAQYVVDGRRYYYPINGKGEATLDAAEVEKLYRQMGDRKFAAEYLNDPTDEKRAVFKRAHFPIIDMDDPAAYQRIPIEIRYGLGRHVTPDEQYELSSIGLKIQAYNFWDPAGKELQSKRGDDTFGVGMRISRYGAIWITCLAAGQWSATETWNQVERLAEYNHPVWSDYEMGVDEKNCRPSFQKWTRDKGEERGITPMVAMHWSHMPKSAKMGRIEKMESWAANGGISILSNAGLGDLNIIEKYIGQWIGLGVTGHDDGPDATSRCIPLRIVEREYRPPAKGAEEPTHSLSGGVPFSMVKGLAHKPIAKTWGEIAS